jgi:hypothetical protein
MATGVEWIVNLQPPLVNNRRSTGLNGKQSMTCFTHKYYICTVYQLYSKQWGQYLYLWDYEINYGGKESQVHSILACNFNLLPIALKKVYFSEKFYT